MRLLFVGLNFSPELVGIGRYSGEMIDWLSRRNSVRVVTTPPHYPNWQVELHERGKSWKLDKRYRYPVRRLPVYIPSPPSIGKRLFHLGLFAAAVAPATLYDAICFRPDVIATTAPALFAAPVVSAIAKLTGAQSWLHVQDFEVDIAFGLSMMNRNTSRFIATKIERRILNSFDLVSSISPAMVQRLLDKGCAPKRIAEFPNWVDTDTIVPLTDSPYRKERHIANDDVVVLYSGTMSKKQGLEHVVEAARILHDESKIHFVFCGEGPVRASIEAQAATLARVHFMDLQPIDKVADLLAMADIHVLPQRAGAEGLVMPSKLGPMLSSGKPTIATADASSNIAEMIRGAGVVVPPENPCSLAVAIRYLAGNPSERALMGIAARCTAERELSQTAILSRIDKCLQVLAEKRLPSVEERIGKTQL